MRTVSGSMQCICCKQDMPVKESESGTLSISCPWCDLSAYAKPGTEAHRVISAHLKKGASPEPASQALPGPVAEPPAPAKKKSVYGMDL